MIEKTIVYKNLIFSKRKFLAKSIIKKYLKLRTLRLNYLKVINNYSFKTRLYSFNTFKYKTSKRLIYGRHLYLLGHMAEQLAATDNCFGFMQVAIQTKLEFPLFREFLHKYDLSAFLFTQRNLKYMILYNFSMIYIKSLLAGGYNFVVHTTDSVLFLRFLLKKIYLKNFFGRKDINLSFLSLNKIDLNFSDFEINFFKKINFLHYKIFKLASSVFFLNNFLMTYFRNSLFSLVEIKTNSTSWLSESIFYLLNYYFRLRLQNLIFEFTKKCSFF
jgi:hypothetical protein